MLPVQNAQEELVARFLAVFDVDSTLIEDEAIDLLAERAGTKDLVSQITDRAMRLHLRLHSWSENVQVLDNYFQTALFNVRT